MADASLAKGLVITLEVSPRYNMDLALLILVVGSLLAKLDLHRVPSVKQKLKRKRSSGTCKILLIWREKQRQPT